MLFLSSLLLFKISEVVRDLNLHLGIVVLITVYLVGEALFFLLLVVHGVLSLVDRVGPRNFLHGCNGTFLAKVQCHLCDVLQLCLHELLLVGWRGDQASVHSLDTHDNRHW